MGSTCRPAAELAMGQQRSSFSLCFLEDKQHGSEHEQV